MATDTVTVVCSAPSGVALRLFEFVDRPFGLKEPMQIGATIIVRCGRTDGVDAEFMTKWLQQNHDNPVVINGCIRIA